MKKKFAVLGTILSLFLFTSCMGQTGFIANGNNFAEELQKKEWLLYYYGAEFGVTFDDEIMSMTLKHELIPEDDELTDPVLKKNLDALKLRFYYRVNDEKLQIKNTEYDATINLKMEQEGDNIRLTEVSNMMNGKTNRDKTDFNNALLEVADGSAAFDGKSTDSDDKLETVDDLPKDIVPKDAAFNFDETKFEITNLSFLGNLPKNASNKGDCLLIIEYRFKNTAHSNERSATVLSKHLTVMEEDAISEEQRYSIATISAYPTYKKLAQQSSLNLKPNVTIDGALDYLISDLSKNVNIYIADTPYGATEEAVQKIVLTPQQIKDSIEKNKNIYPKY